VSFVRDWNEIEGSLPENWSDARLVISVANDANCDRAAALLGPANPGRSGKLIRFYAGRRGVGPSPDLVRRLLRRLDEARIIGRLELVGADEAEPAPEIARSTLAAEWNAALATLPSDWSDLYGEVELRSSRDLERAALALSPLNPSAAAGRPGFRFRAARRFGYGASPEMTHRSLERLDEQDIAGELRILRVLSDTRPVATQGPVWRVGGKAV
jgi:hypothetical protein